MELACHDVMVDLETTGTDPSRHGIIQIAAVRFDYNTGTIGSVFDACLQVPGFRAWDPQTMTWWENQPGVLSSILGRARPAVEVMGEFAQWCFSLDNTPQRFWSKPSHFDYTFLQLYARDFGIELPFHYRPVVDMNSFMRGLSGDVALDYRPKVDFDGDAHNALDDVFHQLKILFHAKEAFPNAHYQA